MGNYFNSLKTGCFQSNEGCGWAELEPVINGLLKNLILVGLFIAAVMISYTGWILFKGMGDPAARSKARSKLINIVVGVIVLLCAYFIVDLILTQLGVRAPFRQIGV